eukprot:1180971-Prorocentrum_minimum.AAC.8
MFFPGLQGGSKFVAKLVAFDCFCEREIRSSQVKPVRNPSRAPSLAFTASANNDIFLGETLDDHTQSVRQP